MQRSHKRIACIPTYSKRLDVLTDAIQSLYVQVDVILIAWNGPVNPKLADMYWKYMKVEILDSHGDMADLAKFLYYLTNPEPEDVIFLCDDDLIYARDYCDQLELSLNTSGYGLISLGGKVVSPDIADQVDPCYNNSISEKYRCFDVSPYPCDIDIPLSGVCAFRAGSIPLPDIDERYKYAADIQLYKLCRVHNIRAGRYWGYKVLVEYNQKMQGKETIWDNHTSKRSVELGKLVQEIYNLKI